MLRAWAHRLSLDWQLARLAGRRPAYLCSYPKSGRTWLRFILGHYLVSAYRLPLDLDFDTLFTLLPNLSTSRRRGVRAFQFAGDARVPLLLSSHRDYEDAEFARGDPILLVREIRDVLVSSYFHASRQRRATRRFHEDIKTFVRDPTRGVSRYISYHNAWARALPGRRSLTMSYERVSREPESAVADLLRFLGVPIDPQRLTEAVESSRFERMRKTEIERGIGGVDYDRADPEALRVRRGIVGGYGAYLDAEDSSYIEAACRSHLDPLARQWLAAHQAIDRDW